MKIKVAWIGKTKDPAIQALTEDYLKRISRYAEVEGLTLADETVLLRFKQRSGTRPAHSLILIDAGGKQLSSEEFAKFIRDQQDRNPQPLLFAIGPTDGFTDVARKAAVRLPFSRAILIIWDTRVRIARQIYTAPS